MTKGAMTDHTPSGQQAVEDHDHWEWWFAMTPRERLTHIAALRTAAPTAPSTAAADTARLDFLDRCNARLNAESGTSYHWKLTLNHNVSRLMLGHLEVDLNDAEARGLPSCRDAIDAKMRECGTPVLASAPSTVVGEPALVCGCGWEGSYADLNETAEGMTCPKCRLSRNMDCAALAAQRAKSQAHEKAQFKIWAEGKFEHIAEHMRWVTISIAEEGWMARAALAAQEGTGNVE